MSDYTVEVSKRAADMLALHACLLAQTHRSADSLIDAFEKSAKRIGSAPKQNPMLQGEYLPEHKYHYIKMTGQYSIIYQVVGETVYIEDVVNTSKQYDWLM